MKLFQWIVKYIKSVFGVKGKPPDTSAPEADIVVSQPPKARRKPSKRVDYISKRVEDLPEDIERNTLYVVGENGYHWLAAFRCPCGCKDIIQLNLLKEAIPCWKVSHNGHGNISIIPSIDRKIGCRSHFTLRNGCIDWWIQRDNK